MCVTFRKFGSLYMTGEDVTVTHPNNPPHKNKYFAQKSSQSSFMHGDVSVVFALHPNRTLQKWVSLDIILVLARDYSWLPFCATTIMHMRICITTSTKNWGLLVIVFSVWCCLWYFNAVNYDILGPLLTCVISISTAKYCAKFINNFFLLLPLIFHCFSLQNYI